MTEQEIMKKIEQSAAHVTIPEGVSPDVVRRKLTGVHMTEVSGEEDRKKGGYVMREKKEKVWEGRMHGLRRYAGRYAAAAAVAALCLAGAAGIHFSRGGGQGPVTTEGDAQDIVAKVEKERKEPAAGHKPKQDAGDLYVTASDYGEVYDAIEDIQWNRYEDMKFDSEGGMTGADMGTSGIRDINYSADRTDSAATLMESAGAGAVKEDSVSEESAGQDTGGKYSATNLQTQGVDESDIIKTDGSYLYIVKQEGVVILDVRQKEMKKAGTITLSIENSADRVREMYVDKDALHLVIEREESYLKKETEDSETEENQEDPGETDVYSLNTNLITEFLTYDISDRSNPVYRGKITQDGAYSTSRKIKDIVYLFTEKGMKRPGFARTEAIGEENAQGWIPLVNGKAVAADCIYIPEQGNQGLLVTSVNVKKPDEIVDNTLIINRDVEVYVSTGALYLYGQDYSGSSITTQIAKFELDDGVIDAVGAASVAGAVTDTFAVNEYKGKLRILTTDWSSAENKNFLYLFDQELKRTGSIGDIAPGEEIYAARYLGDMAYFVTYRNTDPLFAVDLSDEKEPRILSELKITGFSEYLHFWGEDKLLGIGYETDPDTGNRKGIKLTMFDISDPANLKTAGTSVIKNLDYSPALYDYKCVLADAGENMIGFAGESYQRKESYSYLVFSWETGVFREQMTESLAEGTDLSEYRGIYIGDLFYLASPKSVISYDRKGGYRMLQKMEI